jgi:hypothetical protein
MSFTELRFHDLAHDVQPEANAAAAVLLIDPATRFE